MEDSQVRIGSYGTPFEAESLCGMLAAQGIRAWIVDANLVSSGPESGGLVRVGVIVEREAAPRAAEVARQFEEEARAASGENAETEDGKDRCVACNAEFPEYLERCPACGLSYS